MDASRGYQFSDRQPIAVSPNGQYIAVCYRDPAEKVGRNGQLFYSSKGATFEAQGAMIRIFGTENEPRDLFPKSVRSWAPVWSPDGKKLAFFSDADGVVHLWIWWLHSNELQKIPDVIARPFFGFEVPEWFGDSRHLIFKGLTPSVAAELQNVGAIDDSTTDPNDRALTTCLLRADIESGNTEVLVP